MVRDFLDFNDLTMAQWDRIFNLADDIYENPAKYADHCKNKILATLFYEPSTRTQLSFQSAMLKLGGSVIGFSGVGGSSVSKGESLKDTIKIVSGYADIIAIRHPKAGSAFAASLYASVPVINAGDGVHLHPTQTLLDLFTIGKYKNKKFTGLNIGICGDLLNGRTVHSLLRAFSMYRGNNFYLISNPDFKVPEKYLKALQTGNQIFTCEAIDECIDGLDIIYMTRLQKERLVSLDGVPFETAGYDMNLILDHTKLAKAKSDLMILHPLPKNNEIEASIDDDERALYFKQAELGVYIRMALLIILLENNTNRTSAEIQREEAEIRCENPNCILNDDDDTSNLPLLVNVNAGDACAYCEVEA